MPIRRKGRKRYKMKKIPLSNGKNIVQQYN
jgi:hypothetical protein